MGKQMTRRTEAVPFLPGATATGLAFPESLSYEEWANTGQVLARIDRGCPWWIGDWVLFGDNKYGEKHAQAVSETGYEYQTIKDFLWMANTFELSRRRDNLTWSHHREVAALPPAEQDEWLDRAEREQWGHKELRRELARAKHLLLPRTIDLPVDKYATLVIDPPWPMQKIEREVRPNQSKPLDYPTMDLDEIAALPIRDWAAADAHLYLWVTHKFLPDGLRLLETWGFNYQCVMTWVKNVGITPFSWMYSTEHVLFARRGKLDLLKLGQRLDFNADVAGHSRKPSIFYERVALVSPAPRLDVFAREPREGFTLWGNEAVA